MAAETLDPRLDTQEWALVAPVLSKHGFNEHSLQRIRAVLVEGQGMSEVARRTSATRQAISILVVRARAVIDPFLQDRTLTPIQAWLPEGSQDAFQTEIEALGGTISTIERAR